MSLRASTLTVAVALSACGGLRAGEEEPAVITGASADGSSGPAATTTVPNDGPGDDTTGSSSGGAGDTEPETNFDLGIIPDTPPAQRCRAVDFLFVIDNSMSMDGAQTALVNNFPVFIDGIQSTLDDVSSYHVGVVTTDSYIYNEIGCSAIGSLVNQTGGDYSSDANCEFVEGHRYMTEADDLDSSFACAAQVGTAGDWDERPMTAMLSAISSPLIDDGKCNSGFLRDDALLVVVVITDEPDGPGDPEGAPPDGTSAGDPMSWYEDVIAAKGGYPENAVVVSLLDEDPAEPFPTNITEFTGHFGDNGFVGSIVGDYAPLFTQAVDIVDTACENFIPPG